MVFVQKSNLPLSDHLLLIEIRPFEFVNSLITLLCPFAFPGSFVGCECMRADMLLSLFQAQIAVPLIVSTSLISYVEF